MSGTCVVADPITGLPVLRLDADAPKLTNEQVQEILSKFPQYRMKYLLAMNVLIALSVDGYVFHGPV